MTVGAPRFCGGAVPSGCGGQRGESVTWFPTTFLPCYSERMRASNAAVGWHQADCTSRGMQGQQYPEGPAQSMPFSPGQADFSPGYIPGQKLDHFAPTGSVVVSPRLHGSAGHHTQSRFIMRSPGQFSPGLRVTWSVLSPRHGVSERWSSGWTGHDDWTAANVRTECGHVQPLPLGPYNQPSFSKQHYLQQQQQIRPAGKALGLQMSPPTNHPPFSHTQYEQPWVQLPG